MRNRHNSLLLKIGITISLLSMLGSCESKEWPESGKSDILKMVRKNNVAFDCYSSKWVKQNKDRLNKLANLGVLGTNQECKFKEEDILWKEFPEAVSATLRCVKDGVTGEYTISVFPIKYTRYGSYYCESAHFPSSEMHELGTVTKTLEKHY